VRSGQYDVAIHRILCSLQYVDIVSQT